MHRTEPTERTVDPGAPERRLAAAIKQLRIAREDAGEDRRTLGVRIEAAIDEVEAAQALLE